MTYTYPTDDLDRPGRYLELLGSVWAHIYSGRALLEDRLQARLDIERQAVSDGQELVAAVSRDTVPVFHRERWYLLRLLESEMDTNDAAMLRYDDPLLEARYDGSPAFFYDVPAQLDHTFPLPPQLMDCNLIMNRLTEPSVVLHKNIDYRIDLPRRALVFRENPFENALIPKSQIFTDGVVTDREVSLWLFAARFDWRHIHSHFGYVLGYEDDSSPEYRRLVAAVLDAITGGTSLRDVERVVSAMSGIPLAAGEETVQDVAEDARHLLILTDKNAYRFNRDATAAVQVGDTLQDGQSLITAYERWEFRRGEVNDNVAALVLGRGLLKPDFRGELTFENKEVPLQVTGDSGEERIEFEIGGHPLDIEHFWDLVHQNRLVYGKSLYELLQATDDGVPATINPMAFVVRNLLRNNTMAVRLEVAGFGAGALGLGPSLLLRRILPPHATVLLIVELPPQEESITMGNVDDSSLSNFPATETGSDSVGSQNVVDTGFTAKNVSFTCQ